MSILFGIIEIVASFVEQYILFEIYDELFVKHRRREEIAKMKIIMAIIGTAIIHICNRVSIFSYFTILIAILYTSFAAVLLYKINWIPLFSVSSFYILCLSYFDFLIIAILSILWDEEQIMLTLTAQGPARVIYIIVVKVLWIILFILFKKYINMFAKKVNRMYTVLLISVVGFCGYIFLVNQMFNAFNFSLTGVWLSVVVLLAFFIFVTYYLIVSREEKAKLNLETMRNELLEEKYKTIQEIYSSNAKLYHDMNNHFDVLYHLLDDENTEMAKEYIKEIGKPIRKLSKTIWTGEEVVDAVIQSKLEVMKEKNIAFDINVEFPQNTNISQHDMCTILANLLDNAIEATDKLQEDKRISLVIRNINQFIMIKIVNPCIEQEKTFVSYPETTKENKELHGWGLPSVLDTVKKYNGTMECVSENGEFVVSIMMFWEAKKSMY